MLCACRVEPSDEVVERRKVGRAYMKTKAAGSRSSNAAPDVVHPSAVSAPSAETLARREVARTYMAKQKQTRRAAAKLKRQRQRQEEEENAEDDDSSSDENDDSSDDDDSIDGGDASFQRAGDTIVHDDNDANDATAVERRSSNAAPETTEGRRPILDKEMEYSIMDKMSIESARLRQRLDTLELNGTIDPVRKVAHTLPEEPTDQATHTMVHSLLEIFGANYLRI